MTSLLDALNRSEQERVGNELRPLASSSQATLHSSLIKPDSKRSKTSLLVFAAGLGVGGFLFSFLPQLWQVDAYKVEQVLEPQAALQQSELKPKQVAEFAEYEEPKAISSERAQLSEPEPTEQKLLIKDEQVEIQLAPKFRTRSAVVLSEISLPEDNSPLPPVGAEKTLILDGEPRVKSAVLFEKEQALDLSEVDPKLAQAFQKALSETSEVEQEQELVNESGEYAIPIDELPHDLKQTIPSITYSSHVYSSSSQRRRIKINGKELAEGESIGSDLEVLEIAPNSVILRHKGQSFSLEALTDWPY